MSSPDLSSTLPTKKSTPLERSFAFLHKTMNFYRWNALAFSVAPLITAGIFYAANGRYRIDFIDCLFLQYSALTVTGLAPVNLSQLTGFQQALLFVLMIGGDTTFVSWLMVLLRRYYFYKRCREIVHATEMENDLQRITVLHATGRKQSDDEAQLQASAQQLHRSMTQDLEGLRQKKTYADAHAAFQLPHDSDHAPYSPVMQEKHPRLSLSGRSHQTLRSFVPDSHGSFPGVWHITNRFLHAILPQTHSNIARTLTIRPETTLADPRQTPWLDFEGLKISRNSNFNLRELTTSQLEKLGGVEFRALQLLSWLVPIYFFGTQIVMYLIMAPYLARTKKYDSVFAEQYRVVPKQFWLAFNIVSAYTGGGLSLCDQSMVPFIDSGVLVVFMTITVLLGNMILPCAMRFFVWILFKLSPRDSQLHATLSFVLEHPRRVYLYLFPSYQTWFLLLFVALLSSLEWILFAVLDIGLPVIDALTGREIALAGFFQSVTVRASGFAIVNLSGLAPAILFFYIIAMYIAIYPIALAVRSTNVYEQRGLGIYEEEKQPEFEPTPDGDGKREVFSKYLMWHVRRQLTYELWALIVGIFVVCIAERTKLLDEANFGWFDIFRVIFELVSAFAGVGLSLGVPYDDYSFSGSFSTFSKLVVCAIMVRGRLRGLPVAIDRAVLLPGARQSKPDNSNNARKRRLSMARYMTK